jgi:hypothetical protein
LRRGPRDDIHFAAERLLDVAGELRDALPLGIAQKEDVNVAAGILGPERIAPVDEGQVDALLAGERFSKERGDPEGALCEFLQGPKKRTVRSRRPQPQAADAATSDDSLSLQLLECDVHGARRTTRAPDQLARVELDGGIGGKYRNEPASHSSRGEVARINHGSSLIRVYYALIHVYQ